MIAVASKRPIVVAVRGLCSGERNAPGRNGESRWVRTVVVNVVNKRAICASDHDHAGDEREKLLRNADIYASRMLRRGRSVLVSVLQSRISECKPRVIAAGQLNYIRLFGRAQ